MTVELALKEAYTTLLKDIVPCYYMQADDDVNYDAYIVMSAVSNANVSNKGTRLINNNFQVAIYTEGLGTNSSSKCDEIAEKVFNKVWASPQSRLILPSPFFCYSTTLQTDKTNEIKLKGNYNFIQRILIFTNKLKI